jgi:endonuclease-3
MSSRRPEINAQVRRVRERLRRLYGAPRRSRTPVFDGLLRTILSQNTTDVNSARTFASLRARFPRREDLASANARSIAAAIRAGGLADVKARYIKSATREILRRRGGLDMSFLGRMANPEALAWLTALPGVGEKTARVVLLFSLGRDVFPVDTHVLRLTRRLGLVPRRAPAAKGHEFWDAYCPPGKALELHVNLIRHGREVCHARRPRCGACVLADICPSCGEFT